MGLDFDAIDYCRTLIRTPAPYKCPVDKCGKSYKSIYGLQHHLVNYDHDNPQPLQPLPTPHRKKGGRNRTTSSTQPRQAAAPQPHSPPKEALTYLEALRCVQFDLDGKSVKVSIEEPIPVISAAQFTKMVDDKEAASFVKLPPEPHIKLPEAAYKLRADYNICDAPPRSNAYIRFIEKSAEELDGEVEYDVDEEDTTWLSIINDRRADQSCGAVSVDTLELLMDRLEKESYFQAAANGQSGNEVDDDAVCCICVDGECQNTNVILFCDMCNLAVHQDCYGVPYIPEGQWLCRRCLQSPSRPVDCVLCPNTGGAFKQTDHNQWAHVVCALWIPEVRFANTVFLEPIDSIETIPAARWRLTCYICKQKGVGACIQCQRNSCYAAFHVTCAQQAGLHMRMDTVKDNSNAAHPIIVQKTAYCDAHCPTGSSSAAAVGVTGASASGGIVDSVVGADGDKLREKSRNKMKLARKTLAKKRTSVPLILIPTIPPDRLNEISAMVNMQKKTQFIQRLIAYWTLKRQYRNGVPLLRRLQSQGQSHQGGARGIEGSPNASELYQQLKYWQCLRQDLERARLLCELVRKREKLKAALIRTKEACVMMELNPVEATMSKLLESIESKDSMDIFREPVDINEVPDYMDVVTHPMDLGTIKLKLASGLYYTLADMEADFDLMIRNCLAYNNKDTIFYKAGIKMRDQCAPLFRTARRELERDGLVEVQRTDDMIAQEIDDEFRDVLKMITTVNNAATMTTASGEDIVDKLELLHTRAMRLKHGLMRAKRTKQIRIEIAKLRKVMNKMIGGMHSNNEDSSQSDMDSVAMMTTSMSAIKTKAETELATAAAVVGSAPTASFSLIKTAMPSGTGQLQQMPAPQQQPLVVQVQQTPPCSPMKSANNSASPSGVNRRTAVLFTRKAQAALKKPETPVKEESHHLLANDLLLMTVATTNATDKLPKSPKKSGGRQKRNSNRKSFDSGEGIVVGGNGGGIGAVVSASTAATAAASSLSYPSGCNNIAAGPSLGLPLERGKKGSPLLLTSSSSATGSKRSPHKEQSFDVIPDSFRLYRAQQNRDLSDSDESHVSFTESTCSSCSGFSDSGTGSDFGSSFDEEAMASGAGIGSDSEMMPSMHDDAEHSNDVSNSDSSPVPRTSNALSIDDAVVTAVATTTTTTTTTTTASAAAATKTASSSAGEQAASKGGKSILEPLQLVWAKCRGYPWYPALIIDPKIPKGFVYNGVPLPAPPSDVLALRKDKQEPVFLVLFFDAKRTWQWLPANKLELLGMDKDVDQNKLIESRKPTDRKAVKKAYQDALLYQSQVSDLDGQGPGAIM